jgi:hypothetical protein
MTRLFGKALPLDATEEPLQGSAELFPGLETAPADKS